MLSPDQVRIMTQAVEGFTSPDVAHDIIREIAQREAEKDAQAEASRFDYCGCGEC